MTLKSSYLHTTIEKSSLQVCSCHENICPHSTARHLSFICDNCVLAGAAGAGGGTSLGFPGEEREGYQDRCRREAKKAGNKHPWVSSLLTTVMLKAYIS